MRRLLLQECYEYVLSVLAPAPHVDVFLWTIYTLYALFKTQICVPTVYIDVDFKMW
jgi:hypothetical protein